MENVKKINLGEIFEVDGKLYLITNPNTASDDVNGHGQIVILLDRI